MSPMTGQKKYNLFVFCFIIDGYLSLVNVFLTYFLSTGKTALGNYIRNLDFNTIPMNFDTFAEYPARQMERIEDNFHQSITFDELKVLHYINMRDS